MEKLTLTIQQPAFCKSLGDEVWQYLVHDLKRDKKFVDLTRRYYAAVAKYESNSLIAEDINANPYLRRTKADVANKEYRHAAEINKQCVKRTEEFSMAWINKYGSAELTIKEMMTVLEGEDRDKFVLRCATVMFLTDWMEDCFMEMNACIRNVLPDAKHEPLKDFFTLQKMVSTYLAKIFDDENSNYQEFFDEHAAGIKMTIYNKVNAFINANEARKLKEISDRRQLSFNFTN